MSRQLHYYQVYANGKGFETHWAPMEFKFGKSASNDKATMTSKFAGTRQKSQKEMGASMAFAATEQTIYESQQPLSGAAA
ncbi:MAG: hypothetical protein M0Z96_08300 [Actinomycetota bacterium]|nr:hypothetical protein [Actinomycetota bacterium]